MNKIIKIGVMIMIIFTGMTFCLGEEYTNLKKVSGSESKSDKDNTNIDENSGKIKLLPNYYKLVSKDKGLTHDVIDGFSTDKDPINVIQYPSKNDAALAAELGLANEDNIDTYNNKVSEIEKNPQEFDSEEITAYLNRGKKLSADAYVKSSQNAETLRKQLDSDKIVLGQYNNNNDRTLAYEYKTTKDELDKCEDKCSDEQKAFDDAEKDIEDRIERYDEVVETLPVSEYANVINAIEKSEDRLTLVNQINKKDCSSQVLPSLCEVLASKTQAQIVGNSYIQEINQPTFRNQYMADIKSDDSGFNLAGNPCNSIATCRSAISARCKKEKCKEETDKLLDEYDKNSRERYNKNLIKEIQTKIKTNGDVKKALNECTNDPRACEDKLDKVKCASDDDTCKADLANAEAMVKNAQKVQKFETNWAYTVVDAIFNVDQNAIASSKLFGIEADMNRVPDWLKKEGLAASHICLAQIDGYLDEEENAGGQTTKYNIDKTTGTKTVVYDLRARRTPVTPDNKTQVTISYYLVGHATSKVKYQIGLGYKSGGKVHKEVLFNGTEIAAGGTVSDFKGFNVDVKGGKSADPKSFQLYLRATDSGGGIYLDTKVEAFLITSGTGLKSNVLGNNPATSSSSGGTSISSSNFWAK